MACSCDWQADSWPDAVWVPQHAASTTAHPADCWPVTTHLPHPCRARQLKDSVRGDLVQNLSIYKGVEQDKVKVAIAGVNMHPAVARACDKLRGAWISVSVH
jgi:hypothetical protein